MKRKVFFAYVKHHYKGAKIIEAGRVTDAKGKITYEAEVKKILSLMKREIF